MSDSPIVASKDLSTVTASGERKETLIHGVVVRPVITQIDERGEIAEMYSKAWGIESGAALEHVYMSMIRPGKVKGWVYHKEQSDRMFSLSGFVKYVLWDNRADSPTFGLINEIHLSERNRGLLLIPPYVVHAVQNIGIVDAIFINMPTVPYNHASPDKYRVTKESVPYSFDRDIGW
ncbi:MAG: dTDP-4-dehydrorhamnose 3,5-epimerase family protein [Pseudomonadota bacterium]